MESSKIQNLKNVRSIYFIGIGGSGMFPLASILHEKGFSISGSDIYESDTLEKVRKLGIKVNTEQVKENISGQDLVVFSAAIKETNPEIIAAKEQNIPIIERSVMLGIIFKKYKNSVGVSGTHGKTTTSSMITSVLIDGGKSPTAVIGATLKKIGGNSCVGKSDIIVGEACEYVDSFLKLYPSISIITNVEADHLDYFKTFENVKKSFHQFASQTKDYVIVNGDDEAALECTQDITAKVISYGISESNDYFAKNINYNNLQHADFDVFYKDEKITHLSLKVTGKHNVYNSLAALIAGEKLGVDINLVKSALENFTGAHRRFELLGNINGITVVDDFAHHPTELSTTLKSTAKMGFNTVWAVFQPHTFSRTAMFLDDFVKALSNADKVIISDILPVREINTYGVYAQDIVDKMSNAKHIADFEGISDYVCKNAKSGDLIITLGGGNIYKCANMIVEKLKNKN